jgi:hypothetical protein
MPFTTSNSGAVGWKMDGAVKISEKGEDLRQGWRDALFTMKSPDFHTGFGRSMEIQGCLNWFLRSCG